MAIVRQTYLNDGGGKMTTPVPTSGRTKHVVTTGTVAPIKRTNQGLGISVGGTQRQAEAKQIISSAKEPDAGYNRPVTSKVASDSGSASSGGGGGDYSSSSSSIESALDRALKQREAELQKQRDLLAEQEQKAKEAYQAQYEMQRARNKEAHRDNADQINLNRARAERWSRNQFGSESGANNTNMARIGAGWMSDHNKNNRSLADNDATALTDLNRNLSNAYNTLASGYSNFILPVTTNDINYLRELQYRRDANAMDYDYRKFLTNAGLM